LAALASTRKRILVIRNHIGAIATTQLMQSMTTVTKFTALLARFQRYEVETFAILSGIVLPVLVGATGLGT
jgi:hypothetical protein